MPSLAIPDEATGCSGDVCVELSGNPHGTMLLQGWAKHTAFTGVFVASGPGSDRNRFFKPSPDKNWRVGKNHSWPNTRKNAPAGQYCISGFSNSSGYEGTACETLK